MMERRVFLRVEKSLACDLRPGDLFILENPDQGFLNRELNGDNVAMMIFLRTNVSSDEIEDRESIVWKILILTEASGEPLVRVNPHAPPGMKEF